MRAKCFVFEPGVTGYELCSISTRGCVVFWLCALFGVTVCVLCVVVLRTTVGATCTGVYRFCGMYR